MAAGDGLIVMTPTSINVTGTSGSINADGGVDFTAVTSLSLNGVFTSAYDNYLIVIFHEWSGASGGINIDCRLRAAGSDASGSNYTYQNIVAADTSLSGARTSNQTSAVMINNHATLWSGSHLHLYGPALAQPTATRSVQVIGDPRVQDWATTHSLSTSYDGITFSVSSDNLTGSVTVFGYEE